MLKTKESWFSRMSKLTACSITLLVSVSIIFFTACDPATRAKGTVRDKTGNPIQDVSIILESNANGPNANFKKESEQKNRRGRFV